VAAFCFVLRSPLFEIALVLVHFDHVASVIENANHYPLPLKKELARNRFRASSVNFSF
jgi:hypothetical protein